MGACHFLSRMSLVLGVALSLGISSPSQAAPPKPDRLDTKEENFTQDAKRPETYKNSSGVNIRNQQDVKGPSKVGSKEFSSTVQFRKLEFIPYKPNFETINEKPYITIDTDVKFQANFTKDGTIPGNVSMDVRTGKPRITMQVGDGKPEAVKARSLFTGVRKKGKAHKDIEADGYKVADEIRRDFMISTADLTAALGKKLGDKDKADYVVEIEVPYEIVLDGKVIKKGTYVRSFSGRVFGDKQYDDGYNFTGYKYSLGVPTTGGTIKKPPKKKPVKKKDDKISYTPPSQTISNGAPVGDQLVSYSPPVQIRAGVAFGGTNVKTKGDLLSTTTAGNSSGNRSSANPFVQAQFQLLFMNPTFQQMLGLRVAPLLHFYMGQNLSGYQKIVKTALHNANVIDSYTRMRRGFVAGIAVGAVFALQDAICGPNSLPGCMELAFWAGPLISTLSTQTVSDETQGGGNFNNRFTDHQTLLGFMIGAQWSYMVCQTCQLPTMLTLGGQLNFHGNPDTTSGRSPQFGFRYDGVFDTSAELLFWVGMSVQLNSLFAAAAR